MILIVATFVSLVVCEENFQGSLFKRSLLGFLLLLYLYHFLSKRTALLGARLTEL